MAKINIKRALNKKTLTTIIGAGGGFYAGQKLSESGVLDKVTAPLGASIAPWANAGIKLAAGAVLFTTGKGDLIKSAGLGMGVNGVLDIVNEAMVNGMPGISQNSRGYYVGANDAGLSGNDAGLNGYTDESERGY